MDCIFCKIKEKEIPSEFVMEEKRWFAIKDINPEAPVHVLVIPKEHTEYLEDSPDKAELIGELILGADKVAHKMGIADKGYRVVINQKEDSGQILPHLHVHVLGGKHLGGKILG
jgi:histidine triad (HIT) family protein